MRQNPFSELLKNILPKKKKKKREASSIMILFINSLTQPQKLCSMLREWMCTHTHKIHTSSRGHMCLFRRQVNETKKQQICQCKIKLCMGMSHKEKKQKYHCYDLHDVRSAPKDLYTLQSQTAERMLCRNTNIPTAQ